MMRIVGMIGIVLGHVAAPAAAQTTEELLAASRAASGALLQQLASSTAPDAARTADAGISPASLERSTEA